MKNYTLFGTLVLLLLAAPLASLDAQMVGTNTFCQGNYVEVGISECGVYGTDLAPPVGYHPNVGSSPGIGFVADPDRDGWASTAAGGPYNYCGDYFVPGSPVEGWSLTFDGTDYINTDTYCSTFGIPGANVSYVSGADEDTATWMGSVAGMTVIQTTYVPTDSLYFLTRIKLINTTAATMTSVYYGRNVDPDQEQPWTGDFTTTNKIISQPVPGVTSDALVLSVGVGGYCYLGLGSQDDRASANYGGFATPPADDLYFGVGRVTAVGSTNTADEGTGLGFSLGDISPGDSVSFAFVYILDTNDLAEAMLRTAPGCDPAIINLTVSTCGSYDFGGTPLTTSGIYTQNLFTFCGADSTVNLNLTIAPTDVSVSLLSGTLTAAAAGITYQWVDCDLGYAAIAGATSQSFTPPADGHYAVVLTNGTCVDTSACTEVLVTAVTAPTPVALNLYPNPISGNNITITLSPASANMSLEIMNYTGQVVWSRQFSNTTTVTADLSSLVPGVYFVKAKSGDMEKMIKVLKM